MRNTLSVRATSRTFKAVLGAGLAGALLVSALPSASAATAKASVGGVCTKVGDKAKVAKINVECKAVSGKNIWTDSTVYRVSISANAILGGKNNQTLFNTDYESGCVLIANLDVPGRPMHSHQ
jgi:hypothetical protein